MNRQSNPIGVSCPKGVWSCTSLGAGNCNRTIFAKPYRSIAAKSV